MRPTVKLALWVIAGIACGVGAWYLTIYFKLSSMEKGIVNPLISWVGLGANIGWAVGKGKAWRRTFFMERMGGRAIVEKFKPPQDQNHRPPGTLGLWLVGLYIALFGIASGRYEGRADVIENRISALENRINAVATQKGDLFHQAFGAIDEIQQLPCPAKPELLQPLSVLQSLVWKDDVYRDGVTHLRKTVELWKSSLDSVSLNRAYLRRADLIDADLRRAYLIRADLSGAYLIRANLSGANLNRANLSGANLEKANLIGADLIGANLRGAILNGANLSRANLQGADLSGAENLTKEQIDTARIDEKTKLPSNLKE